MPSVKEIYHKIDDVRIEADSINLNVDGVEALLGTAQADLALIKTDVDDIRVDIANGVSVSGTVTAANQQGTSVTTSTFASTTPSSVLASADADRKVLTIFNEGKGILHICAGATCTTTSYQVRLSTGDYYEVPLNQTSLAHSAVFATAGTARVTEVS